MKRKVLLFFCLLWGFWILQMIRGDRLYSSWEKRMLSTHPEMTVSSVADGSYEKAYEEWLSDQFPGRELWVSLKTRVELLLGKKEIEGIYIGKDGYEFAESEATTDWDKLEQKMQNAFGKEMVSRIHVPHAGNVLTDKLPEHIRFEEPDSLGEKGVLEALRAHAKDSEELPIYYRTDHHWTMRGAYYAYEAWIREQGKKPVSLDQMEQKIVKEDFLGTHYSRIHYAAWSDVIEVFDPGTDCEVVYDLGQSESTGLWQEQYLDTDDAYRYFLDGNHGVVQITSKQGEADTHLVVLKDSFANCLVPFLTLHYEKITVIDPRYFRTDIAEWLEGQDVTQILLLSQDTTGVIYE
jgi:hypothetical protein